MPTTYATAFAAHHARGSTLSPPDTTFRRGDTMIPARDTMVHRPTMIRARDTMVHRPTMIRARDTTTTTRSTQSLGDFSFITSRHFENFPEGAAALRAKLPTGWALAYQAERKRIYTRSNRRSLQARYNLNNVWEALYVTACGHVPTESS